MKKLLLSVCVIFALALGGWHLYMQHLKKIGENPNYLQTAMEAETSNSNFLYAKNASLLGRLWMTYSGKSFKTCINTASSFYNKYHTCSKCEHFVKNPARWGFVLVSEPQIGDMFIQYDVKSGRAFHAGIVVNIENGKCYVNHAIRANYYKNVELKDLSNFAFYRYINNRDC